MLKRVLIMFVCFGFMAGAAQAGTATFSGYFNDQANTALKGADLGAALFGDDWEIANNVALYPLSVPFAGAVTFDSNGFAVGGADPYFTLFAGNDTAATVAGSNYDQAFSTGDDFLLTFNLAAGDYQVAMGVFANMSSAENWGSGTLGDGFTFLGGPGYLGNYYYELGVTTPDAPQVPEPCTLLLIIPGLAGLGGLRKKVRT